MKIKIDGNYRYKNGGVARILCVDRPGVLPVLGMTTDGLITCHTEEGVNSAEYPVYNLIEVGQWDHIQIDAKVFVWDGDSRVKHKRHFAGVSSEGRPMTWESGLTSFSSCGNRVEWVYCEVAE